MGAQPAKYFPFPTPYGQSPDTGGVLQQAKAAPQAPLNNFLPLNPQGPAQAQQPQQQQPQPFQNPFQGRFGQRGLGEDGGYSPFNRNLLQ